MKRNIIVYILLLMAILVSGCSKSESSNLPTESEKIELTVAAAASLQDAAKEIKELYADKHPEVEITYNFASSGTLQKQIEEGAPADLFISAGKKQMDALAEKDLIVKESRRDLLGNKLVLIAARDVALEDFDGLTSPSIKKISIGTPETVPAGKYAEETLTSMELYDRLLPKIVFAKDVRAVLNYVETGNAQAGMVYMSDTYQVDDIVVITAAPEESHSPIVYPMAIVKASKNQSAAQAFSEFLSSSEAAAVFTKYGFDPL
ncbi:MAG: molybdate ABC transporter substrate-binding protein [Syntrophomonadales bacterium]